MVDKAELLGLLRMSGAIVIRGLNVGIHFSTENARSLGACCIC